MARNVYLKNDMDSINMNFQLDDNTILFRYMDFSKFVKLLEDKRLFFCNTNYFEDKLEGEMPEGFYKGWPDYMKEGHKSIADAINKAQKAFICCWNKSEEESYALWKIYTNPVTGVAIKSTIGDLRKALNNGGIELYKVKYIKSFEESDESLEPPFYFRENKDGMPITSRVKEVYKLSSYKYEDEVRAVYIKNSKEIGLDFEVDLVQLVNEVYVSPFAPKWFVELVQKLVKEPKYQIADKEVKQSDIKLRGKN